MAMERYRAWGERELDVTAEELEQWLNVMGAAVLSVLSGYVVQTQLLGKKTVKPISRMQPLF